MPHGVRFVDVLEDALEALHWDAPASEAAERPRTVPFRPVITAPLYTLHTSALAAGGHPPGATTISAAASPGYASAAVSRFMQWDAGTRAASTPLIEPAPRPAAASARPAAPRVTPHASTRTAFRPASCPRLSAAQRRALETVNRLGAGLGEDYSSRELRSAFRTLARRYHPDRHPGATDAGRQRLSEQFSAIRTSYETLRTALDASPGRSPQ